MRRLAAFEVLTLISTLAIAQAETPDEPGIPTLGTVTVTGSFNPAPLFIFNTPTFNVSPGSTPSNPSNRPAPDAVRVKHALDCAKAYGKPGYAGPRANWRTYFTENHGWKNINNAYNIISTTTSTPPSGVSTKRIGGITFSNKSHVFRGGQPYVEQWIETLAHEWAHQWGAIDGTRGQANDAGTIGAAARAAYKADNGARCGGIVG